MANMMELIELFGEQHNRSSSFEGSRGVRNFTNLVTTGLGYRDLESFLEDNSGAMEALVEWISDVRSPEWKERLTEMVEVEDDEEEYEEAGMPFDSSSV